MLRIINALILAFLATAAAASDISGTVRIVDADTLWVGSTKVRLHGIDAQETGQTCELADGRIWSCGAWATSQARIWYEGTVASCHPIELDVFGRVVAKCSAKDGHDIGARLVRQGVAEAFRRYSLDYIADERIALASQRGIWRGRVQSPADFREFRVAGNGQPNSKCVIKGNISRNDRIYHLPGQRWYNDTKINPNKGERWFCTEQEAVAAGWRKAKV